MEIQDPRKSNKHRERCREDDYWSVVERNDRLVDLSAKVTEALEDHALKVAIEMGHTAFSTPEGVVQLVHRIEDTIPYGDKEDDARDLYHLYTT